MAGGFRGRVGMRCVTFKPGRRAPGRAVAGIALAGLLPAAVAAQTPSGATPPAVAPRAVTSPGPEIEEVVVRAKRLNKARSRIQPALGATLNAIREHQISLVIAVPSMYGAIVRLKDAKPEDFKNIYAVISGGEPLPAAVRDAFKQKLNVPIYEGYG